MTACASSGRTPPPRIYIACLCLLVCCPAMPYRTLAQQRIIILTSLTCSLVLLPLYLAIIYIYIYIYIVIRIYYEVICPIDLFTTFIHYNISYVV